MSEALCENAGSSLARTGFPCTTPPTTLRSKMPSSSSSKSVQATTKSSPGRAATPGSGEDTWGSATLTELIAWPDELNVERYRAAESLVDSANTTAFALQPAASGCRPAPRLRPGSDG